MDGQIVSRLDLEPAFNALAGRPPENADRRLRILHVVTHLDLGGAEGVAMSLIETLRPQFDFALFAVLGGGELSAVGRDMAERLERWHVPCHFGVGGRFKSGGVIVAALALVRALKRFRADVVHVHTETPELTFAVACALSGYARRLPLLRTVHNSTLWIDWHRLGGWVTGRLAHGDAVAVSRSAADADSAIVTRRSRSTAAVIYNGVRRAPPPDEARAVPRPFRLLFAGRLVHQKGADLLPAILTAAHRHTALRDVEVTIAGKGMLQAEIERGLAGRLKGWDVRLVPPIERLASQVIGYDAVLLPSRFEGFALLPLEVLLAGVPLITTNAPGLDEAIPPDYPLKAPVNDVEALGELLARVINGGCEHRAVAAAYGDDLALRFSPVAMAEAYAKRYHLLAGSRGNLRA